MDGHFYNVQCILDIKYDSFDTHYEQHFNYTNSCNDLHNL